LGIKISNFFENLKKNFTKIFLIFFSHFLDPKTYSKNFKFMLIYIPKFIELNSELFLSLGLGSHSGLRPNIYFFLGVWKWLKIIEIKTLNFLEKSSRNINSIHFGIEIKKTFQIFDA